MALLAAATVPISRAAARASVGEPPPEWSELESWMTALRAADLVEPEALRSWEERLAALRRQPKEHWYDPSSLEAGDALKDELRQSLRSLAEGVESAEEQLADPTTPGDENSAAARREAGKRLENALSAAMRSGLPMKPELAEKLKGLAQARRLSPEELAKLRQRLQNGRESFRSALLECRQGHRLCTRQECRRGSGGIARGPGPAPLILMNEKSTPGTSATETLPDAALQDAQIGDIVKVEQLRQHLERGAYRGSRASGAASVGSGGEAVWRHTVTPEERALLERYFK
jgi:hypothetical protein